MENEALKNFSPPEIEQKWYAFWQENNLFAPTKDKKNNYCIMLPPPNITGTLHMGHAFSDTIIDVLIRYHRMLGLNTLWQPGTDHAGIATQMVVERQLEKQGIKSKDIGREAFLEAIWDWKSRSGDYIKNQMCKLGTSADWQLEKFTMDKDLSLAVTKVFVDLYEQGLIYRGKRLVNWDPVLMTAVSDLEVINVEEEGLLYYVEYPFVDMPESKVKGLPIATTRPETILADGALAVNPDDERYKKYLGCKVWVPMTERKIPIIADEYVDSEFGTGIVKITPAHDFNDYEVGQRHSMEIINLFNEDATMNENAPQRYQTLDRFVARERIVKDLKAAGMLIKSEKHIYKRPYGDRTNQVIEPYLTDQWFVKMGTLAEPAINAVREGKINFVPKNWENTYFDWMNNIQDWCVSRQIWWGHRVPAWYDSDGSVYVGQNEQAVRTKYNLAEDYYLTQDTDVLDTWFSSALWPFSTLGWPNMQESLAKFYPTNVLVTGFDIIFFWVARMIMFGLKFTNNIPFDTVYIHGLIRDPHGNKMSKSKGNVLDPMDLINGIELKDLVKKRTEALMNPAMASKVEEQTKSDFPNGIVAIGTDALRFTFMSLASPGRDIRFDYSRAEGYKNYCNKLWNATRFVLMNTTTKNDNFIYDAADNELFINEWILSRLQQVADNCNNHLKNYRFDLLSEAIYSFTWHDYCDWYLEMAKTVLNDATASQAQITETRQTMLRVLDSCLRLQHPIMPYITEELWQLLKSKLNLQCKSISIASYPKADLTKLNMQSHEIVDWLRVIVGSVRQMRSQMQISPAKQIDIYLKGKIDISTLQNSKKQLLKLAKISNLEVLAIDDNKIIESECAISIHGDVKILIPMKGLVDVKTELARLAKSIQKLEKTEQMLSKKLNNSNFVSKAKPEIVEQETLRYEENKQKLLQLRKQYELVNNL